MSEQQEFADCGHGSDDRHSCFGCAYDVSVGPETQPIMRPRVRIRYSLRYVEQEFDLRHGRKTEAGA